jgi:glycosyltransferase involved in cell wall biosynthesis
LNGTNMPAALPDNQRQGIVFYGGHFLLHNKGVDTLFKAMSIIQQRMGANTPTLSIHGHYAAPEVEEATRLAHRENGVANTIVWLDELPDEDMVALYQRSLVCVLPYTGSFAGLPASLAAACQLPVVCTRKAGLPDHLGESGVWVEENNPEQLAERIIELVGNDRLRQEVGARLLKRAQEHLCWDVIADRTLKIYEQSMRKKAMAGGQYRLAA